MKSKKPIQKQPRKSSAGEASRGKETTAVNKKLEARTSNTGSKPSEDLLIAAIGASAGGIESSTELLKNLPGDTGVAFILIQHMDPKHESVLTELLAKQASMPVKEVKDGMRVEGNHIYVIPPNAMMSISDHELTLSPRGESATAHMTIDHFMRSLAEAQGNRAMGVILSGYGTDGTLGMREIQAQGGVTFAQDETTAKFANMPRSAVSAGCVDYVLSPKGIARELVRIARHPYVARPHVEDREPAPTSESGLNTIFQLLRKSTGLDFSQYRQTTILRRVHRRMAVHKLDGMKEYVKYAQSTPGEVKALYQDMLINVTSFFRNPAVFEGMKSEIFPAILKNRGREAPIRIWTPGCASGEETYSVAIALLEFLGVRSSRVPVQFFGTDVNDLGVVRARNGVYPENIEGDVSAERLRQFFAKAEGGYRISKNIRDLCIFAQHNVLHDPPFSQMDVICCRNLLIYLEPAAQSRVISTFHYATRQGGFLVLGTSEGVGSSGHLFGMVNRSLKFFARKGLPGRHAVTFSLNSARETGAEKAPRAAAKGPDSTGNYLEIQKEFDRKLLAQYAPAAVFVNEDLDIIHTRGEASRYFKLAAGRASLSVLKMAREGLLLDLRNAINRAKKENVPVRKQNVQMKSGNGNGERGSGEGIRAVNFEVAPFEIGNQGEKYFMVVLEDAPAKPAPVTQRGKKEERANAGRVIKLEQELSAMREYLQSVIETQEATNEELQSANEEILSSNEELQSTNEELETAKEELQSANEELSTVNDELRTRNVEVAESNTDLKNLLESIDMAIVMVGSDLTIRRFTPRAQNIFGLLQHDVGRPLSNINPSVALPDFQDMVRQVMANPQVVEGTLADKEGKAYRLRVVPYRLGDGRVAGTVITVATLDGEARAGKD